MTRDQKLNTIYRKMPRDFKGKIDGERTVMILRDGGTRLVYLRDLTDNEIERLL
ncbi:hypothetical protein [Paracoccus sp. MKU1]|uniref:hypothetical protein n=1 Tax=Paracoccus sp. MKU1 TaxID=1745182 RepID=UPI000AE28691|nr:hypothetical protein [Paracoccus sp. MKU1]